jgi:sodium-dependent dicarboxylate transporter 2/3/5
MSQNDLPPNKKDAVPIEELTPMEQAFERVRHRLGLFVAPVVFLLLLWLPIAALDDQPLAPSDTSATQTTAEKSKPPKDPLSDYLPSKRQRLAAVMVAVVILWMTEALPMPLTALLGAAACVMLQVGTAKEVFTPFADPLMFLFIGSFIVAQAIFLNHLDRRLAFGVLALRWVDARPSRILFMFGLVTAVVSGWVSNTATTAMMFAIGMSILAFLYDPQHPESKIISRRYATGLMLITTFAASIGGLATPVGTPTNVFGLGTIKKLLDIDVPFFQWCLIGVPAVVILFLFLFVYLNYFCPAGVRRIEGCQEMLEREKSSLGPWTTGQRSTLVAFLTTVVLWIMPGIVALVMGEQSPQYKFISGVLPESVAALLGAALLFLLPGEREGRAITWSEAADIDWGVILLYGGGVALGTLSEQTGLAAVVGKGLTQLLPLDSSLTILIAAVVVATMVSETTSNTASATVVVPLVIALAKSANVDAFEPALGATMACSLGFMLPVSTPCNAIVYGSGYVPLGRMVRYGILLDLAGMVTIVGLVRCLSPWVR